MALNVCRGESPWAPVNSEFAEYNPHECLLPYEFFLALTSRQEQCPSAAANGRYKAVAPRFCSGRPHLGGQQFAPDEAGLFRHAGSDKVTPQPGYGNIPRLATQGREEDEPQERSRIDHGGQ